MERDKEVTIDNEPKREEIDKETLLIRMLERVLDDYALLKSNHKNYKSAKDWLFGETKPLLEKDNRGSNYTIENVCTIFAGKPIRIRRVALFMRRFRLSCKKFSEIYWDDDENQNH